jgi:hypothetical protein
MLTSKASAALAIFIACHTPFQTASMIATSICLLAEIGQEFAQSRRPSRVSHELIGCGLCRRI